MYMQICMNLRVSIDFGIATVIIRDAFNCLNCN